MLVALVLSIFVVMICVLVWCTHYAWFADNRKMTDTVSRSETSWNKEHEFFDTITEFQDDFS